MFKYLVLSDIHLGHSRNQTSEILHNLDLFFNYFTKYKDLDALFIAGDLFDTLLDNHTSEYHDIVIWISRLMDFCSRNNIKLRVLEGTPSHDWNQCKIFKTLHDISKTNIDFKYINNIYIEFLEDKGLYILYVPDEATESSKTTYTYIKQLMFDLAISTVDIAIMHGMFGFQMNNIVTNQTHNETDYLDIVKYYIHIGHIHTHNKSSRIIAQGSFDRLAHGEEENKGCVLAIVDKVSDNYNYEFLINTNAKIFKTINIPKNYTLEQTIEKLDKSILSYPIGSYIRIKAIKDHIVYQAFEEIKKRYINYTLSKKNEEDLVSDNKLIDDITNTEDIYDIITITKDNIVDLLLSNLTNNELNQDRVKEIANSILNQT